MREVPAMTKMSPLLERNEQFAATYTPGPLGPPAAQVVIVTCLDHRVDPAIILGLGLGDAVVIRNAGGRVTQAVIDDVAYLAFLAEDLFSGVVAAEGLFEVDRKSTRLNSSHVEISYAVFCLKKKKTGRMTLVR